MMSDKLEELCKKNEELIEVGGNEMLFGEEWE